MGNFLKLREKCSKNVYFCIGNKNRVFVNKSDTWRDIDA